ncbi:MAG: glycosyltransferase, partial [Lactobacillus sp.]|nr:glycosyltransferase [Lactobacillus sp.]
MPKISLIIPLYNAGKYMKECLDSVKAQTFKDFECLLINDVSTDETQRIIEEETKGDARFKIFKNDVNSGVSYTRNRGMELAEAPYLMFLDQDDLFHPQAMEMLYKIVTEKNTDVAAFNFQTVDDDFVMTNPPVYDLDNWDVRVSDTPFEDF